MFGNPIKSSKSFDSRINASIARKELHPLIIMKIIANIETLQALSLKENSKAKNIPDVIYWYDRLLLLLKEDGHKNYGIPKLYFALSLQGRLHYYEPYDDDIPNNDLNNLEWDLLEQDQDVLIQLPDLLIQLPDLLNQKQNVLDKKQDLLDKKQDLLN